MRIDAQTRCAESMRQLAEETHLTAHAIRRLCTVVGPSDMEHVLFGVAVDLARISGSMQVSAVALEAQRDLTQSIRQLAGDARMAAFAVDQICTVVGPGNLEDELIAVARDLTRLSGRITTTADCLERRE